LTSEGRAHSSCGGNREAVESFDIETLTRLVLSQAETITALTRQVEMLTVGVSALAGTKPSEQPAVGSDNKSPRKAHPGAHRPLHPNPTTRRDVIASPCQHCSAAVSSVPHYEHIEVTRKITNAFRIKWGARLYADVRSVIDQSGWNCCATLYSMLIIIVMLLLRSLEPGPWTKPLGGRTMRSLVTSLTTLVLLVLASTFAATKPGCADTVINVCGKFSFWVPDTWRATKESLTNAERSTFESGDGNLYAVAGPLLDKTADLSADDVSDFAAEEFTEAKATSDTRDKLENFHIRLVNGTGSLEGESTVYAFKLLALDSGVDQPVLVVLVYGDEASMSRAENQATIERVLRSIRPHR
jgi:hypothetical protein